MEVAPRARVAAADPKTRGATKSMAVTTGTRQDAAAAIARVATEMAGGEPFVRLLVIRLEAARDEAEREMQVLDAMLPPVSVLTDATTTQLMWNAKARADAVSEFGALTAAQVEESRGVQTNNPHVTVGRWIKEGKVFAVEWGGRRLFPTFQFSNGEPRPVITRVLAALADQLRGWEVMLWFTGSSGYLNGARPVDRLSDAPDEVVAAAAYQAAMSED
jgi:hypothetical protein